MAVVNPDARCDEWPRCYEIHGFCECREEREAIQWESGESDAERRQLDGVEQVEFLKRLAGGQ